MTQTSLSLCGLAACLMVTPVAAQSADPPPPASSGRSQVLVLGTFHFRDAGLDDFRPRFSVDVFAPERQREIADLLNRMAAFRPTAVAVEWPADRQSGLDSAYAAFRTSRQPASANEREQLGFRLAARLGHDRVFAIDAPARWYDLAMNTDTLVHRARRLEQHDLLARAPAWNGWYAAIASRGDSLKTTMTLTESLARINTPAAMRRTLGQYLVGTVEVGGQGDYSGADMRSAWYNRNLRIFTNLLRMQSDREERILVIIGAGHAPLLRHFIENAPELRLVLPEVILPVVGAEAPPPTGPRSDW
jgi:hypothetical protein